MSGAGVHRIDERALGRQHEGFAEVSTVCNGSVRICIGSILQAGSQGFGGCDTDTITIQSRGFLDGDRYRSVLTLGPAAAKQLAEHLFSVANHMLSPQLAAMARQEQMRMDLRKKGISGKPSDAERPGEVD